MFHASATARGFVGSAESVSKSAGPSTGRLTSVGRDQVAPPSRDRLVVIGERASGTSLVAARIVVPAPSTASVGHVTRKVLPPGSHTDSAGGTA